MNTASTEKAAQQYAVFDLDGTLADNRHRIGLIRGTETPDWDAYYQQCIFDGPIRGVIDVAQTTYWCSKAKVLILTGRVEKVRRETEAWLNRFRIPYHNMIMRETKDRAPDYEFKARIAKDVIGLSNILFAVEDRARVVEMWRKNGILCLQCSEGKF